MRSILNNIMRKFGFYDEKSFTDAVKKYQQYESKFNNLKNIQSAYYELINKNENLERDIKNIKKNILSSDVLETFVNFCHNNRKSGTTTTLIKTLINTPKCYVVCGDINICSILEKEYNSVLKSLMINYKDNEKPIFVSIKDVEKLNGMSHRPILVDNSVLMILDRFLDEKQI